MNFGISDWKTALDAAKTVSTLAAGYATVRGIQMQRRAMRDQRRHLATQEAAQKEAHKTAQAEKMWSDRELRYRMGGARRGGMRGYGMNPGGSYPTGLTF